MKRSIRKHKLIKVGSGLTPNSEREREREKNRKSSCAKFSSLQRRSYSFNFNRISSSIDELCSDDWIARQTSRVMVFHVMFMCIKARWNRNGLTTVNTQFTKSRIINYKFNAGLSFCNTTAFIKLLNNISLFKTIPKCKNLPYLTPLSAWNINWSMVICKYYQLRPGFETNK